MDLRNVKYEKIKSALYKNYFALSKMAYFFR